MTKRILGSALLILFISLFLYFGRISGAFWLVVLLTVAAQNEMLSLLQRSEFQPYPKQVMAWTVAILLVSWYLPSAYFGFLCLFAAIISLATFTILKMKPHHIFSCLWPSVLALVYIPSTLLFAILILRGATTPAIGLALLTWVVIVSKLSDIGGLFTGALLGRHLLAHDYSPAKTIEGFLGGILTSIAGGYLLWIVMAFWQPIPIPFMAVAPIALAIAVVSAISDLTESAFKRMAQVKDSGHIIPGIGGALDFVDSLIFALPCAYILLCFFGVL